MITQDALLHQSIRAANRLARACFVWEEWKEGARESWVPHSILLEYDAALAAYREAESRARGTLEASG